MPERSLETTLFEDSIGAEPAPTFTDQAEEGSVPENLERQPEMESSEGWAGRRCSGRGSGVGRVPGGTVATARRRLLPPRPGGPGRERVAAGTLGRDAPPAGRRRAPIGMDEWELLGRVDGVLVGRAVVRSHRRPRPRSELGVRDTTTGGVVDVAGEDSPAAPVVLDVSATHP